MNSKIHLSIQRLSHHYPGQKKPALDDISIDAAPGEIIALIGGSGSGKSTLLRCIAGLEKPKNGTIELGDISLTTTQNFVPPEKRKIGMVSQSGDLFPHLTILKNVAYGLHKLPRADRKKTALSALELVGLRDFASRYPAELSGGEAQRVALARALAFEPELILLDEPFSNLDAILRDQLRSQTLSLLKQKNVTTIFVTHHGDDALAAGDRLAVLRHGKLIQFDSPRKVWEFPADHQVAALFGGTNFIPSDNPESPNCLRPEQLQLCSGDRTDCLACGTVERVDFLGSSQLVMLRIPGSDEVVRVRIEPDHFIQTGATMGIDRK